MPLSHHPQIWCPLTCLQQYPVSLVSLTFPVGDSAHRSNSSGGSCHSSVLYPESSSISLLHARPIVAPAKGHEQRLPCCASALKTITAVKKSQAGKDRAVESQRQTEPMSHPCIPRSQCGPAPPQQERSNIKPKVLLAAP